jgi:hypothetical protein
MGADKVTEALLDGLKLALAENGREQRLFRSGKLAGVFAGRTGVNGEAARRAIADELLNVVRTETKGKTTTEWVRLTPRGERFLHEQESPVRALDELRAALQAARDGVPAWQAEIRRDLDALAERLTEDSRQFLRTLEALTGRVEQVLRRLEQAGPDLPEPVRAAVPWGLDAVAFLDRRRADGHAGGCPLPDLFAAVSVQHPGLAVSAFHDGLKRLQEERALRLLPLTTPSEELPEPEFALFDRDGVFYHAAR